MADMVTENEVLLAKIRERAAQFVKDNSRIFGGDPTVTDLYLTLIETSMQIGANICLEVMMPPTPPVQDRPNPWTCNHEVVIPEDYWAKLKKDKFHSVGAYCRCGLDFGWLCPKSPNHYCDYNPGEENCIHCGMPSERK